jgi:hypothetical protein
MRPSWLFFVGSLVLLNLHSGTVSDARADVTYSYTGNPFTIGNAGDVTETIDFTGLPSNFSGSVSIASGFYSGTSPTTTIVPTSGLSSTGTINFTGFGNGIGVSTSSSSPNYCVNPFFGNSFSFINGNIQNWTFNVYVPSSAACLPNNDLSQINTLNQMGGLVFDDALVEPSIFGLVNNDPGVWTPGSPTSAACLSVINNSNNPTFSSGSGAVNVALSGQSASQQPYNIQATFAPNMGVSLSTAAQDCGVASFDWQQTVVTLPQPSPFTSATNPFQPLTAPFLDAPPGGYNYTVYCNSVLNGPLNPTLFQSNPSTAMSYPFYYQPNGPTGDCMSLGSNETSNSLSFFDSPADNVLGPGQFIRFQTCVVGVDATGNPVSLPTSANDCFNWIDNYQGLLGDCVQLAAGARSCAIDNQSGGITGFIPLVQLDSAVSSGLPDLGDGGISILENVPVPEPSSLILLLLPTTVLLIITRRRGRLRDHSNTTAHQPETA